MPPEKQKLRTKQKVQSKTKKVEPMSKRAKRIPVLLRKKMQKKELAFKKRHKNKLKQKAKKLKSRFQSSLGSLKLPEFQKKQTYLDKKGKFDIKKIKSYKSAIPTRILMMLPPKILRDAYFTKSGSEYTFRPPNRRIEIYLSLKICFADKPEIRGGTINGQQVVRKGLAGSFFYVRNGAPYSYGAIYADSKFNTGKKLTSIQLTALEKKYPKASATQKKRVTHLVKSIFPGKLELATQLILTHARNEGINPVTFAQAFVESKKTGRYPSGIIHLSGREDIRVLIPWYASLISIKEQEFKASAKKGQLKDSSGSYSKKFLSFAHSGTFTKKTKLHANYYKRWIHRGKLRYRNETTISSTSLSKMDPVKYRRLQRLMYNDRLRRLPAGAYKQEKTFDGMKGNLRGRWAIPSGGVFAGSHISSEKSFEQLKGKKVTLDLMFPGIRGSARGRFNHTYRAGENRIGVGIEDAFPIRSRMKHGREQAIYLWRNMMSLNPAQRRSRLITYFSNLVKALEGRGLTINECTMSGHSGGGRMLHYIAELFPGGQIPLNFNDKNGKPKTLRIKGYFAADSHYFENSELYNSYFSHEYKDAVIGDQELSKLTSKYKASSEAEKQILRKKIKERTKKICDIKTVKAIYDFMYANISKPEYKAKLADMFKNYGVEKILNIFHNHTTAGSMNILFRNRNAYLAIYNARQKRTRSYVPRRMIMVGSQVQKEIVKMLLRGSLSKWEPPKYYATALDTMWRHQARLHRWGKVINGHKGVQYVDISGKNNHWNASGRYIRQALDNSDNKTNNV